jgi:cobalt-zinc-cadmium efflux system outer membrane protein
MEVERRLGQDAPADASIQSTVRGLLARPLTPEAAAAVALLNNPSLAGDFEGIGIAQAEWVQAGLLRNPVVNLGLGVPTGPPSATRIEASFTTGLLQLLTLPRRRQIAEQDYLAARARICARAVSVASDAKVQVILLQADEASRRRLVDILNLEEEALALAERQHAAGDIPDLELARRRDALAQRRIECDAQQANLELGQVALARLLGTAAPIQVAPELPPPPGEDPPPNLEQLALAQRWEVVAARADVRARARALGLANHFAWADSLDLGAQFERDVTGQKTVGPTFGLPLPLFDRADARTVRAAAELRAAEARVRGAELQARLDVREARARLAAARSAEAHYRDDLVPARHELVRLVGERYNAMYAGPFDLIAARQAELAAEQQALTARRDTWLAWFQLERAAGGNLHPTSHDPDP